MNRMLPYKKKDDHQNLVERMCSRRVPSTYQSAVKHADFSRPKLVKPVMQAIKQTPPQVDDVRNFVDRMGPFYKRVKMPRPISPSKVPTSIVAQVIPAEFNRGKRTRAGKEFGGAPIDKRHKTAPAEVFDPNDTSAGIPQPPTTTGPIRVRPFRVKRVATLMISDMQN
jgi:hypothetical protein